MYLQFLYRILAYLYDILEKKKTLNIDNLKLDNTESETSVLNAPSKGTENEKNQDELMVGHEVAEVKVHISYMEIYQDTGYDLLNPGTRPGSLMLALPKVHVHL